MTDKISITEVVFSAMEELNQQLPDEQQLSKSTDTVLFGLCGKLDSLGLVNLIVAIEQGIAERFDLDVPLADEKAMSQKASPFRTVGALVDYIAQRLDGNAND